MLWVNKLGMTTLALQDGRFSCKARSAKNARSRNKFAPCAEGTQTKEKPYTRPVLCVTVTVTVTVMLRTVTGHGHGHAKDAQARTSNNKKPRDCEIIKKR